jgi:hypothetical protein
MVMWYDCNVLMVIWSDCTVLMIILCDCTLLMVMFFQILYLTFYLIWQLHMDLSLMQPMMEAT